MRHRAVVIGTALPRIVHEVGGDDTWYLRLVTAYLITSTVSVPVYGRFGDLFGRKRLLLACLVPVERRAEVPILPPAVRGGRNCAALLTAGFWYQAAALPAGVWRSGKPRRSRRRRANRWTPPTRVETVTGMDVLRQHEIAEAGHRILNPFTDEKLMLLGSVCRLRPGQRLLDLASGKGELLCRWAAEYGVGGVGVDISEVFVPIARARAAELGVADRVRFDLGDAARAVPDDGSFDVVSCVGASWIGGGVAGTIELMRPGLREGGLLLIGEPYWTQAPPQEAYEALGMPAELFTSLHGTLERFEAAGLSLVEMVLADGDSWDRYVAAQWWTVDEWLRAHPDHPDAPDMRRYLHDARHTHLKYQRTYLGWGVFVLRVG